MLKKHKVRDGGVCLVAEMGDDHLRNLIKMKIAQLGKLQDQMTQNPAVSEFQARLYGMKTIDVESAAEESRQIIEYLYPYLSEAFLRGMDDLREPLRKVIGRDGRLVIGNPLLPASVESIDELLNSFQLDESLFPIK